MTKLTAKQELFVKEYLVDLNATQAAIRAGYSEKTANEIGAENLAKPSIKTAIEAAQQARSERTEITADKVLQQWWKIATADPNGLVSFRRTCCRYCHGVDHEYQWNEREYEEEKRKADKEANDKGTAPVYPLDIGGYGFNPTLDPHPGCTECHGEGEGQVHIVDTRKVSGPARALYAGAKQTAQGIEIKMRDQDKALELVAKHLGMFKEHVEFTGDLTIEVVRFSDDK